MFGRIQTPKSVAKSGGKDANPILFYDKRNGLTAEYLLIRKEFSAILRTCTGDFVLRCKHFASNWCEQAGGESSVQGWELLREHGCTGKMKRNSIRGVSNSIKSEIWRFFDISLVLSGRILFWIVRLVFSSRCGVWGMLISLSFVVRTVPVVPPHHNGVWGWLYDLRSLGSILAVERVSWFGRGIYHFVKLV